MCLCLVAMVGDSNRGSNCQQRRSRKRLGKRERHRLCKRFLQDVPVVRTTGALPSLESASTLRSPVVAVMASKPPFPGIVVPDDWITVGESAYLDSPQLDEAWKNDVKYLLFPELSPVDVLERDMKRF